MGEQTRRIANDAADEVRDASQEMTEGSDREANPPGY
jgi:hypothetical protein